MWLVILSLRQVKYNMRNSLLASENLKGGERMYIIRASITLKDGTKIYARDYGKRGFPIWIGPGSETISGKHINY